MLAISGFSTIIVLMVLVMTKKTSIHFSLVIVPIFFALVGGAGITDLGKYIGDGVGVVAQTGVMLLFATLYFSVMFGAGMFDPLISRVVAWSKGDPAKLTVGTAIVAMLCHLDGSGSSTYLIAISALIPIYRALSVKVIYLAIIAGLCVGVMNIVPWGGPTLRTSVALNLDISQLYLPMIPVQAVGILLVLVVSYLWGKKERNRLGGMNFVSGGGGGDVDGDHSMDHLKRPSRVIPNVLLTVIVILVLISGAVPLAVPFLVGLPIALMMNYPSIDLQKEVIESNAKAAIYTVSVIFSAGVFTGVLRGTGMIDAMATTIASAIPHGLGDGFPFLVSVLSFPMNLMFDTDSFYFGVVPVFAGVGNEMGISSLSTGTAALMGHSTLASFISPLVGPTWLLVGLTGVHLGDLQRKGIPVAFGISMAMSVTALLLGLYSR